MVNPQGYKDPLYMQKWRAANRERIRLSRRAYYEAHKADEIANAMRHIYEHYGRFLLGRRAVHANRRYQGRFSVADVAAIFDRDKRTCYWCGRENLTGRSLTLEHLKPVNDPAHVVTACLPCNAARKHLPQMSDEERRMAHNARNTAWRAAQRAREHHA